MATEHRLVIIIEGRDQASGPLNTVGGSLQRIGEFAMGGLLANAIVGIGNALQDMASRAFNSVASLQQLQVSLETLAAREIARGQEVISYRTVALTLTDQERAKIGELNAERDRLINKLELERIQAEELLARHAEAVEKYGAESLQARELEAQYRIQLDTVSTLEGRINGLAGEVDALTGKEGQLATVQVTTREGVMSVADAMAQAGPKAQDLMRQLRDISLISPFEYEDVAETLRLNMAFGLTSDTAMGLTRAILDTAAAMGMDNAMLDRFTYNLAQAIGMGDLTAANLRQLKMVGFDLADVFESELGMSVEGVREALQSGAITAEQVSEAFMNYAANNFGGAAERLSRTVFGLKSSFNDLFTFAAADLLSPALEVISEELGGLFDLGREFLESGVFQRIGETIAEGVREAIATIREIIGAIQDWWASIQQSPIMDKLRPIFDWLAEKVGPLLTVKNLILGGLAAIGVAFAALAGLIIAKFVAITVAAAPWLAIIGAIIAIGYALYTAWKNNLWGIQEKVAALWVALQEFGQTLWTLIQEVWAAIEPYFVQFYNTIAAWWEEIAPKVQEAWDIIWGAIATVIEAISGFIEENMDTIVGIFEGAWQVIYNVLQIAWTLISGLFSIFINIIRGDWQAVWEDVKGTAQGVWNGIVGVLSGIWNTIVSIAQTIWSAIGDTVTGITTNIVNGVVNFFQPLIDFFSQLWEGIKQIFQSVLDALAGIFLFFYEAFQGNWDEAWTALTTGFTKAWEDLKSGVETIWNTIVETATTIFEGLRDTLVGVWDEIKEWFQTKWDEIVGWLSGIDLKEVGQNILQGLWDGLVSIWEQLKQWWDETIGWLAEQCEWLLGMQSPSTVFFNIGQNITKGMLLGMQSIELTPPLPDGATLRGYNVQGSGATYDQRTFAGDTITVNVTDRDTADYLVALLEDRRRERLAAFMGA